MTWNHLTADRNYASLRARCRMLSASVRAAATPPMAVVARRADAGRGADRPTGGRWSSSVCRRVVNRSACDCESGAVFPSRVGCSSRRCDAILCLSIHVRYRCSGASRSLATDAGTNTGA